MTSEEQILREEMVQVARLMYDKGLICASDGNISVRLSKNRFLITPSGLHKAFLKPEQILVVNEMGTRVDAPIPANAALKVTSELPMHLEAYRQRPDVEAVVHAHPPIAVSLSIAQIPLNEYLLPEAIVFLGKIPITPYATPSTKENAEAVRIPIRYHDALVLERHGSLTVGGSVMEAFMRLETLEQHARIAYMTTLLGNRRPLEQKQVDKLLAMRAEMGLGQY